MIRAFLLCCLVFPFAHALAKGQGVTTGSLGGRVSGRDGTTTIILPGATVKATHLPTGAVYGAVVRSNGAYTIRGMRSGGPYSVTATFVGYTPATTTDIVVRVGETVTADLVLQASTSTSETVVVVAQDYASLDRSKTGAGSVITNAMITAAPTINRSITDMARLNPYANQVQTSGSDGMQGLSIAGVNSRFNNFQIDGAVANDLFSLSTAGTSGGQANANFISLDAIDELKVNVSPYDVRQSGFTGGLVNAITRGGTNTYHGSVFFYGRNQDLVGLSPDAGRRPFDAFRDFQFGGRLGGPIVENTLLFHVTAEMRLRNTPIDVGLNDPAALNNFPVNPSVLQQIDDIARTAWGYDAGGYDRYVARNNSINVIGRLDWNIDENNKLQLRHNFTHAIQDRNVFRDARRFSMGSQGNAFTSINNQSVVQWNAILGPSLANELRVSVTQTNDERILSTDPFPEVRIQVAAGTNVSLGPERSSQANALDQTQIAITDDLTTFLGDHTITVGTHNEFNRFNNLFIQDFYGSYQFASVDAFRLGTPNFYRMSYANADVVGTESQPRSAWSMAQLGAYVMDEWKVSSALRLTGGLRVDLPIYLTKPYDNPVFAQRFPGLSTSAPPALTPMFSPRIGFNYDVTGDNTWQLRGGTGLFTGRVAAVWLSNQYANTGMDVYRAQLGSNNGTSPIVDANGNEVRFDLNAERPIRPDDPGYPGAVTATSAINITDSTFRLPQVWRSTLGTDIKLDDGITLTVEGMYGAFLNTVDYQNINLRRSQRTWTTADGRTVSGVSPLDGRPLYAGERADSLVAPEFTQVLVLRSRSEGYQYSVSSSVNVDARNKYVPGLSAMLSYTFGHTYDLNAATAATASSQYSSTDVVDPNNVTIGRSNYDVPHRVAINVSYQIRWSPTVATTLGLFYSGSSGRPFSLTYSSDYNGDNVIGNNDLIYVPRREDYGTRVVVPTPAGTDLRTADQVWEQIMRFVESNPVLVEYQGRVLDRNAMREPWINQLDLRITQKLPALSLGQSVDVTLDIQNVLNLLSSSWGLQRYVNFQSFDIFQLNTAGGTPFDELGRLRMSYTEPVTNGQPGIYFTDNFYSRWRMQLGIRYSF